MSKNSNLIPVKKYIGLTTVVFCACELMLLFSIIPSLIWTCTKLVWGSLTTEQITESDRWKLTDAVPGELWIWQDEDRRVFFASLVRRCGKQPTLPRSQLFSSVEDNTCRRILLILSSFHAKYAFFKHRSHEDALSSPQSPLEQPLTYAAVCSVLQHTATENSENLRL